MENYLGLKYRLKKSDEFENYLKHLEIGYLSRKTAVSLTNTACLTKNDDGTYTFTLTAIIRTVRCTFTPGKEFVDERPDGVKVKSLIEFHGNGFTHTQIEDNGRKSTHVREFTPDTLTVDTSAARALYNALIRSKLESGSMIWNPYEKKYTGMVEKLQNKFLRFLYLKEFGVYPFYPLMYPTLFVMGMTTTCEGWDGKCVRVYEIVN